MLALKEKSKRFKICYTIIALTSIIITIWILIDRNRTFLINNYPTITKETEISGKVTKVNLNRGMFCIDLSNGKRVKSMEDITDFKKHDIAFFLNESDSIFKKANSDTIIVKRFRDTYYFVLRY
jgi:hypothetical protein